MLRRTRILALIGGGAAAVLAVSSLPLLANDDGSVTIRSVADTTVTQVAQDGDNSAKTTLASCPQQCDGNPHGQRDAIIEFAVSALPANVVEVRAKLRVYAWRPSAARVVAHAADSGAHSSGSWQDRPAVGAALQTHDKVVQGYNEWDVSAALRRNGTFTFALLQETYNSRVYWASQENHATPLRPELVLSYKTSAQPVATATQPGSPPPPTTTPTAVASQGLGTSPGPGKTPTSSPAPPALDPAGWKSVWSDEFNGTSVDKTKWNVRTNEGRDIDLGCETDSPQNVFENNGTLTVRALRATAKCSSQTRAYTEGYLDTIGKASFTYGRFEMRAKSPNQPNTSRGLWPAFWLRPNDGGNGEIDVVELPGGAPYYKAATQAIFYNYTPVKQDNRYTFPAGYAADGFHTYTTEWEPGVLRWYIDGKQVYQRDRSSTPWFDEAFSRPFNIRLNFQVGGWLGNPDASTVFPADFQVDYVRVWQR
jgi:hypothetical protein